MVLPSPVTSIYSSHLHLIVFTHVAWNPCHHMQSLVWYCCVDFFWLQLLIPHSPYSVLCRVSFLRSPIQFFTRYSSFMNHLCCLWPMPSSVVFGVILWCRFFLAAIDYSPYSSSLISLMICRQIIPVGFFRLRDVSKSRSLLILDVSSMLLYFHFREVSKC